MSFIATVTARLMAFVKTTQINSRLAFALRNRFFFGFGPVAHDSFEIRPNIVIVNFSSDVTRISDGDFTKIPNGRTDSFFNFGANGGGGKGEFTTAIFWFSAAFFSRTKVRQLSGIKHGQASLDLFFFFVRI